MVIIKKDLSLVRQVVKEELKDFKEDFRKEIDEMMDIKFAQQRSDLLEKLDRILKEVVASRQEETLLSHRVSDHEDRITALESTHN